jgi:response regulator of citrate/malate metabolism
MEPIKLSFASQKPRKLSTVYIIEDNPMQNDMIIDFFEKYPNITAKGFLNGDACLKDIVVSNVIPDLILLDYFLDSASANKDGLEILTKIKEVSPYSEIVMFTSIENQRIIELARKKGAMGYIVKKESGFKELEEFLNKNFAMVEPPEAID